MFGDDLSPRVTNVRVGSGTAFGRAREEGRGLTREVRLGLAVCSGLCRGAWAERRGKKAARQPFPETENVRRLTGYTAAIFIRWGIKRTPNAMKLGTRPTNNITTPHANFHPIPRTFPGHS